MFQVSDLPQLLTHQKIAILSAPTALLTAHEHTHTHTHSHDGLSASILSGSTSIQYSKFQKQFITSRTWVMPLLEANQKKEQESSRETQPRLQLYSQVVQS